MNLFVYGTLKKGGKYHYHLNGAKQIMAEATAAGVLYDTGLGYPAMRLDENGSVTGEVYEVPERLWPKLDELEDCTGQPDDLYEKVIADVKSKDSSVQRTVIYVAKDASLLQTIIKDGVWRV